MNVVYDIFCLISNEALKKQAVVGFQSAKTSMDKKLIFINQFWYPYINSNIKIIVSLGYRTIIVR